MPLHCKQPTYSCTLNLQEGKKYIFELYRKSHLVQRSRTGLWGEKKHCCLGVNLQMLSVRVNTTSTGACEDYTIIFQNGQKKALSACIYTVIDTWNVFIDEPATVFLIVSIALHLSFSDLEWDGCTSSRRNPTQCFQSEVHRVVFPRSSEHKENILQFLKKFHRIDNDENSCNI